MDMREYIKIVEESKPIEENLSSLPSLLTAIPDDLVHQLTFLLRIATKIGFTKAALFLRSSLEKKNG